MPSLLYTICAVTDVIQISYVQYIDRQMNKSKNVIYVKVMGMVRVLSVSKSHAKFGLIVRFYCDFPQIYASRLLSSERSLSQ